MAKKPIKIYKRAVEAMEYPDKKMVQLDYVCEHIFLNPDLKRERNPFTTAQANDSTKYRALFCGDCGLAYNGGALVKVVTVVEEEIAKS